MPRFLTVDDLVTRLQSVPGNLQVRLAVQPDWPFAHFIGTDVVVHEGIAYIAEDGQADYLPRTVTEALMWA